MAFTLATRLSPILLAWLAALVGPTVPIPRADGPSPSTPVFVGLGGGFGY